MSLPLPASGTDGVNRAAVVYAFVRTSVFDSRQNRGRSLGRMTSASSSGNEGVEPRVAPREERGAVHRRLDEHDHVRECPRSLHCEAPESEVVLRERVVAASGSARALAAGTEPDRRRRTPRRRSRPPRATSRRTRTGRGACSARGARTQDRGGGEVTGPSESGVRTPHPSHLMRCRPLARQETCGHRGVPAGAVRRSARMRRAADVPASRYVPMCSRAIIRGTVLPARVEARDRSGY